MGKNKRKVHKNNKELFKLRIGRGLFLPEGGDEEDD